jgi:hypothetical protein
VKPGCTHRIAVLLAGAILAGAGRVSSQVTPLPAESLLSVHVIWPLVDFVVEGDSVSGVELMASPNLATKQGGIGELDHLRFEAILVRQWTGLIRHAVDSLDHSGGLRMLSLISPVLPAKTKGAYIGLGYDPGARPGERFFFLLDDSVTHKAWRVGVAVRDLDGLLAAMEGAAQRGAVQTRVAAHLFTPITGDSVIKGDAPQVTPPRLISHPTWAYPPEAVRSRREGRVWMEFVIDTLGQVELQSVRVVLSDGDDFTRSVRDLLPHLRYQPGRVFGKAVRVEVFQQMNFLMANR